MSAQKTRKSDSPFLRAACEYSAREQIGGSERNETLASLAGSMRRADFSEDEILAALLEVNAARCVPLLPEDEILRMARSPSVAEEGDIGALTRKRRVVKGKARAEVVCISDVKERDVSYLAAPYIPNGMLTVLAGIPGVGKSHVSIDFAANVARGVPLLPSCPKSISQDANVVRFEDYVEGVGEPRNVVAICEDPDYVVKGRFVKAGGDTSRLFLIPRIIVEDESGGGETSSRPTAFYLSAIEAVIQEKRPALVIIDPIQAFTGARTDFHRANEVRAVLDPLCDLADRLAVALIVHAHVSKAPQGAPLHKVLGSVDFVAAARSVLFIVEEDDSDRRALVHAKSSHSLEGDSQQFQIGENGITWTGQSSVTKHSMTFGEHMNKGPTKLETAITFLEAELAGGERVPMTQLRRAAGAQGIAWGTLHRAREHLGVCASKTGEQGAWDWALPKDAQGMQATHDFT